MDEKAQGGEKSFLFRELHRRILIGTASARYAGCIGQVYSEGRYEKGIPCRSHKVSDKTFNEETLPVESVTRIFLLASHPPFQYTAPIKLLNPIPTGGRRWLRSL